MRQNAYLAGTRRGISPRSDLRQLQNLEFAPASPKLDQNATESSTGSRRDSHTLALVPGHLWGQTRVTKSTQEKGLEPMKKVVVSLCLLLGASATFAQTAPTTV